MNSIQVYLRLQSFLIEQTQDKHVLYAMSQTTLQVLVQYKHCSLSTGPLLHHQQPLHLCLEICLGQPCLLGAPSGGHHAVRLWNACVSRKCRCCCLHMQILPHLCHRKGIKPKTVTLTQATSSLQVPCPRLASAVLQPRWHHTLDTAMTVISQPCGWFFTYVTCFCISS